MNAAVKPFATVSAAELASNAEPLRWIADGLFLESGAGILGGAPKSGKSFLALELCVAIASGTPCAGHFPIRCPGPVTLLCAEDPQPVLVERLRALCNARSVSLESLPIHVIVEPAVRLPDGLDRLSATIEATHARLLLLDPLIRLHRADENSAAEMSVILDGLRTLARSCHTAILLVHHTRKAPAGNSPGSALRGSSDLHAFGDTNLYLRKLDRDGVLELRIEHRATACPEPLRIRMSVDDGERPCARILPADKQERDDPLARKVFAVLSKADKPLSLRALREQLGVRNQSVSAALAVLLQQQRICRAGRDGFTIAPDAPSPVPVPTPICREPEPPLRDQLALPLRSRVGTIAPEQRGGPPPGDGSSSDGFDARASSVRCADPSHQPEDDSSEPGGGRGEGEAEGQRPCSRLPPGDAHERRSAAKASQPPRRPRDDRTVPRTEAKSIAGRGRAGTGDPIP
jgi:hypothetical protein